MIHTVSVLGALKISRIQMWVPGNESKTEFIKSET